MANKEDVKREYENTDLSIANIAIKYDISANTIKSWKARDKKDGCDWVKKNKKVATKKKKVASKEKEVSTKTSIDLANEYKKAIQEQTKLKIEHEQFCQEYIIDMNATRAYEVVYGCSYDTARANGSALLAKANVKERIKELMNNKNSPKIASQDEVLEFLTSMMRGEIKESKVVFDRETGEPYEMSVDSKPSDRTKAGELLGKRYGVFTDKLELKKVATPKFSGEDEL